MRHRVYKRYWFSSVSIQEVMFCIIIIIVLNGIAYKYSNIYLQRTEMSRLYSAFDAQKTLLITEYTLTGIWSDNEEYLVNRKGDTQALEDKSSNHVIELADDDVLIKGNTKKDIVSHYYAGPGENPDEYIEQNIESNAIIQRKTRNTQYQRSDDGIENYVNEYDYESFVEQYYFTVNGAIVFRHNNLSKKENKDIYVGFAPVMYKERGAMIVRYICDQDESLGTPTVGPLINTTSHDKYSVICIER